MQALWSSFIFEPLSNNIAGAKKVWAASNQVAQWVKDGENSSEGHTQVRRSFLCFCPFFPFLLNFLFSHLTCELISPLPFAQSTWAEHATEWAEAVLDTPAGETLISNLIALASRNKPDHGLDIDDKIVLAGSFYLKVKEIVGKRYKDLIGKEQVKLEKSVAVGKDEPAQKAIKARMATYSAALKGSAHMMDASVRPSLFPSSFPFATYRFLY